MTMKRRGKGKLARKGVRLRKEGLRTAKAAAGLTPVGKVLTIRDTAEGVSRTAKATGEYLGALGDEVKRQIRKRNPFN